jgi:hypothetical protein
LLNVPAKLCVCSRGAKARANLEIEEKAPELGVPMRKLQVLKGVRLVLALHKYVFFDV